MTKQPSMMWGMMLTSTVMPHPRTAAATSRRRCVTLCATLTLGALALAGCGHDNGTTASDTSAHSTSNQASTTTSASNTAPPHGAPVDAAAVSLGANDVIHNLTYTNYADQYAGLSDTERTELARRQRDQYNATTAEPGECRDAILIDDYVTGLVAANPAATNFLTWSDPLEHKDTGIQRFALLVSSADAIGAHGSYLPACSRFSVQLPVGEAGGGHTSTLHYKTIPLQHVHVDGADDVQAFKSIYWADGEQEAGEHSNHASIYVRATKGTTVVEGRGTNSGETARLVSAQLARISS